MKVIIVGSKHCPLRAEVQPLMVQLAELGHDVELVAQGAEPCPIRTVPSVVLIDPSRGTRVLDCEVPADVAVERVVGAMDEWCKQPDAPAPPIAPTELEVLVRALIAKVGGPTQEELVRARASLVEEAAAAVAAPEEELKPE